MFGTFTVASAIVVWVELALTTLLGRTAVKFVAETDDWESVASHFIRIQLVIGLVAAGLLVAGAAVLAAWLRWPALSTPLRVLALDIPIFAMAALHRAFLIGRGAFSQAAAPTVARWLVRLLLILVLVGMGLSIVGAILATIAGSAMALILARSSIRPPLWGRRAMSVPHIWEYAFFLSLGALAIQLFSRLDLLLVTALSPVPGAPGFYGAAQNLAIGPAVLAGSFSPLLLSTLSSLLLKGDRAQFRSMTLQAIRACLRLVPFVGIGAAAASEIAVLIYGPAFAAAGAPAAILLCAAMALLFLSVATAVLTALGQPRLTVALAIPLIPVAVGAHLATIPRYGGEGAAVVTAVLAWISAAAAIVIALRQSGVYLPVGTVLRSALVTVITYFLARVWEMPGAWVLVELPVLAGLVLAMLVWTGEIRSQDLLKLGAQVWRRVPRVLTVRAESSAPP